MNYNKLFTMVIRFLLIQEGLLSVTVVPIRSDSDLMFCLESYQKFRIDRSLVY